MSEYDALFYSGQEEGSRTSAEIVLPIVFRLLQRRPLSVVDVGCGVGTWLAASQKLGVESIHGIDGDHVPRDRLHIPPDCFEARDLTKPYAPGRRYDLALSLEVAEHLPEERAASFVRELAALAPVVLFSAAIPRQPGTTHVNCQWPAYWSEKFARAGYRLVDRLRPLLWNEPAVEWWYAQNGLVFVGPDVSLVEDGSADWAGAAVVHPRLFLSVTDGPVTLREVVASSPALLKQLLTSTGWRARRAVQRLTNAKPR